MSRLTCICLSITFLSASALHAQTESPDKYQPYGDNPNIFKVLAYKTGQTLQNTAEKVGANTEKGISKIKPKVSETWDGTKTYTIEQADIAKENTRKGIDHTVKKVSETKDKIVGSNAVPVPIEQGTLSQSSFTSPNDIRAETTPANATTISEIRTSTKVQQQVEIKKQSLAIDQNSSSDSSSDETGIPR